mgnify:CR=1 FL=1
MATNTQEIKALKKEINELKDAMTDKVENTASEIQSNFNKDNIIEMATNAGQTAREFMTTKQEQLGEVKANTESMIQKRPFASAAAAFAAGVVLTSLLNRK